MLPELPRQHRQQEASFGLVLRAFVEAHPPKGTCSYELKDTRGRQTFNTKEVKREQRAYALRIAGQGELIRVQGIHGEPDYIFAKGSAFIVIRFPQGFTMIPIDRFMPLTGGITFEQARQVATYTHEKV